MATQRQRQVVVITGASAGVGRAVAHEFARHGAAIALIARGREALEATAREVEQLGGRALVLPADVADAAAVTEAAERAEEVLGPIDVWVNNAMVSVFSPAHQMTPEEYERVTSVTYLGTVHGTLAALRVMRPRDEGVIVQVGSALAYRGIPLQSAYCAAKHAVQGFTEAVRCELLHDGSSVAITMVQLPAINTPQFDWVRSRLPRRAQPVPPIFQPELAARAIRHAAERPRREVSVGGSTVLALLADKLAPGIADRYLAATAVSGQQTAEPEGTDRPDNLFEPLPGDHATHGRFDAQAHADSVQYWANSHRAVVAAGVAVLAGTALAARQLVGRH